jgi:hypothetical protein
MYKIGRGKKLRLTLCIHRIITRYYMLKVRYKDLNIDVFYYEG